MNHFQYHDTVSGRNSRVSTLKEVMEELLRSSNLTGRYKEASLIAAWEKMMGAPIASRTVRLFIKNAVLYVELSSAPLKNELSMGKSRVVELLNKQMGEKIINEVVFI